MLKIVDTMCDAKLISFAALTKIDEQTVDLGFRYVFLTKQKAIV